MERRDVIKAAGTLAAAAAQTGSATAGGNALVEIAPPDPAAFIAGRFAGKTILVTGSARGIGKGVALRLAREGANVVGVDWIKDMGEATDAEIRAGGGRSEWWWEAPAVGIDPGRGRRRWPTVRRQRLQR